MPELRSPTAVSSSPDALLRIRSEVESVFRGNPEIVRFALIALLARGHLLLEDVPGVGKTTLAHALAESSGLEFRRVQFTSDLLPSDVLGGSVYNPHTSTFESHPGPVFTNVLLVDEINRAPPRTQSGLLQAMEERRVSIDGETLALPDPFLVVATQNPFEHHGTYPLPESQLDRFLMRLTIGYPDLEAEREILETGRDLTDRGSEAHAVADDADLLALQSRTQKIHVDTDVVDYLMALTRGTREDDRLRVGVSPRGSVALLHAARAGALLQGRDFVVPADVLELAVPCLAHRVVLASSSGAGDDRERAGRIVREISERVPVPV